MLWVGLADTVMKIYRIGPSGQKIFPTDLESGHLNQLLKFNIDFYKKGNL
jgi:hypothetical protein